MPVPFVLPEPWSSRGWTLKILEKETREPPHVTLRFKASRWRFDLRAQEFMDEEPPPNDVPKALKEWIRENLPRFVDAWNSKYPKNPVAGDDE